MKILLTAILIVLAIGVGEFIRVAECVIGFYEDLTLEVLEETDAEDRKD